MPEERVDAERVRNEVEEQGRRCLLPGDLTDPEFCREAVERTAAELGGLNILVSNAAHLNSKLELDQLTAEDFDRTFKTNVYAYFHLLMAALPHLGPGDAAIATATPLNEADDHMRPDGVAHIGSEAPLRRAAQPEEMTPTFVHLAADADADADSGHTVGEVIAVTGGIVDTR
ncbi:SDR family oxidoreductase [Streptomyces luteogriseus]|uniref:SDR family oxidoreductase n=1 Tax=Streptomyces luteogriseus TaxID=68233 RepID=UPI0037F40236